MGKRMLAAVVIAIVAASPASELRAALADLQNVPPADRPYIRYLSGYTSPVDKIGRNISFVVNSLSNARRLSPVLRVGETLYRLDIRDYQWGADVWEKLQKREPYFRYPWTGEVETRQLSAETNSGGAIFRADWFMFHATVEPFYSQFLGLPPTLAELKAKYKVDENGVRELSLNEGGSVLRSIVAINNRRLERLPTITGYFWQSHDFTTSAGNANLIENLLDIKPEAGEFIWSLPNGLQGYYLANGDGQQQAEAPANIAQDTRTPFRNKSVVNARGCILCHSQGINQFKDVVRDMLDTGNLDVRSYDYNRTAAVDDFYRGEAVRQQIQDDCKRFQNTVMSVCGASSDEVAAEYMQIVYDYAERPVTLESAAIEVGCTVDQLRAAIGKTYSGTLLVMANGQPVARDAWEAAYPVVAVGVKHD